MNSHKLSKKNWCICSFPLTCLLLLFSVPYPIIGHWLTYLSVQATPVQRTVNKLSTTVKSSKLFLPTNLIFSCDEYPWVLKNALLCYSKHSDHCFWKIGWRHTILYESHFSQYFPLTISFKLIFEIEGK